MWAWKFVTYSLGVRVECLGKKSHFTCTFWASEHLAPDGVVDSPDRLSISVKRFVHPAELRFDLS